jgi:hypothetical protein
MYKNKEKQREANRLAKQRQRSKGMTSAGYDTEGMTSKALPANYGQPDCQCKHCRQNRANKSKLVINHGDYKKASELADNEVNRVTLPGDVDYEGITNAA